MILKITYAENKIIRTAIIGSVEKFVVNEEGLIIVTQYGNSAVFKNYHYVEIKDDEKIAEYE